MATKKLTMKQTMRLWEHLIIHPLLWKFFVTHLINLLLVRMLPIFGRPFLRILVQILILCWLSLMIRVQSLGNYYWNHIQRLMKSYGFIVLIYLFIHLDLLNSYNRLCMILNDVLNLVISLLKVLDPFFYVSE